MGLHPLPSPPQMPTPHHCGHPHCNNCHQCRLPSCHDHHHHCYVHRHGNLGVITTAADINTTVSRTSTAKVLRPITAVTPSLQRGTTRYHCSINYQRDKQHCICHRFLHKICMGTASQQAHEIDVIIIPTLQMRTLLLRDVKQLFQGHTAKNRPLTSDVPLVTNELCCPLTGTIPGTC